MINDLWRTFKCSFVFASIISQSCIVCIAFTPPLDTLPFELTPRLPFDYIEAEILDNKAGQANRRPA